MKYINVYVAFIRDRYKVTTKPEHTAKYVWLAEKLNQAINKRSAYIDDYLITNDFYSPFDGDKVESHMLYTEILKKIKLNKVMI